jgi:hypothetical protein
MINGKGSAKIRILENYADVNVGDIVNGQRDDHNNVLGRVDEVGGDFFWYTWPVRSADGSKREPYDRAVIGGSQLRETIILRSKGKRGIEVLLGKNVHAELSSQQTPH